LTKKELTNKIAHEAAENFVLSHNLKDIRGEDDEVALNRWQYGLGQMELAKNIGLNFDEVKELATDIFLKRIGQR
jgi:hypothetical protein